MASRTSERPGRAARGSSASTSPRAARARAGMPRQATRRRLPPASPRARSAGATAKRWTCCRSRPTAGWGPLASRSWQSSQRRPAAGGRATSARLQASRR
eukprot:1820931-Lingulodinium_polyedra.AAC.1